MRSSGVLRWCPPVSPHEKPESGTRLARHVGSLEVGAQGEWRAAYGQDTVKRLAARLTQGYGRGYSHSALTRMKKLAAWHPGPEIVATLSQQLTWSHLVELLTVSDQQKRDFYTAFAAHERWSVRTLRARVASKLYERTLTARGSGEGLAADERRRIQHQTAHLLGFLVEGEVRVRDAGSALRLTRGTRPEAPVKIPGRFHR
jgi:hypothetical protein